MATIDRYEAQLTVSLLDGVTTVMSTPGSETSGSTSEISGGFTQILAASASDVNIKLGTVTDPVLLALWGDQGVSFKVSEGGQAIAAYPFAALTNIEDGLDISEIWVTNGTASEQTFTYIAVE